MSVEFDDSEHFATFNTGAVQCQFVRPRTLSTTNTNTKFTRWPQIFLSALRAASVAFTLANRLKLDGIEDGAARDLIGSEIKALYEGEADTIALTDVLQAARTLPQVTHQVGITCTISPKLRLVLASWTQINLFLLLSKILLYYVGLASEIHVNHGCGKCPHL